MINIYRVFYDLHGTPTLYHSNSVESFSKESMRGYVRVTAIYECQTLTGVQKAVKFPHTGPDGCVFVVTPLLFNDGAEPLNMSESDLKD